MQMRRWRYGLEWPAIDTDMFCNFQVPVRHVVTEEDLAAAEVIQGFKTGGFSPFTSPLKDLFTSPASTFHQQHTFTTPSHPTPSTPSIAQEASTGGLEHTWTKTFSTGSGDDSILSATDLETAAYVSIPRPVSQVRASSKVLGKEEMERDSLFSRRVGS